jgi:histidinol dehydrogenase
MPVRLDASAPDFEAHFAALLDEKREAAADVNDVVREIVDDVRKNGDRALLAYTKRFDRHEMASDRIRVGEDEIEHAFHEADQDVLDALKFARDRIEAFHIRQRPQDDMFVDEAGVELGSRWTAIEAPAGRPSMRSGCTCPAAPRAIRLLC